MKQIIVSALMIAFSAQVSAQTSRDSTRTSRDSIRILQDTPRTAQDELRIFWDSVRLSHDSALTWQDSAEALYVLYRRAHPISEETVYAPDTLTYDSAKDVKWAFNASKVEGHTYALAFNVTLRTWQYFLPDVDQPEETDYQFGSDIEGLKIVYDPVPGVQIADSLINTEGNLAFGIGVGFQKRPLGYQLDAGFSQLVAVKNRTTIDGEIRFHIFDIENRVYSPLLVRRFSIPLPVK